MSSNFTVIYDACVPYPTPLHDLLMRLALTDLYRARWTGMIHDEWTRNVLKQRPDLKAEDLERTRSLMNPPKTADEYLDTLLKQGLTQTVGQLREWKLAI
ncbi:MAG: hypothetical protein ACK5MY_16330 [Jhaorihella sp.]